MIKICGISDLHGSLPVIGQCNLVCICGDLFPLQIQRINSECETWLNTDFTNWVKTLPCEKIILIPGNHDFPFERYGKSKIQKLIEENETLKEKLIYLVDELYEYNGLSIYGCPWCTGPYGWAFIDTKGENYKNIPDCDILLTHQPPRVKQLGCSYPGKPYEENWGAENLKEEILKHNIKYNLCGHIHTGTHGGVKIEQCNTLFYNVSIKDEDYKVMYQPTYIEIEENDN